MDTKSNAFRFEAIKEDRDWYFVEYSPPTPNNRFSVLQLIIIEAHEIASVAAAIESEAKQWLARYPVPLMATAFSADGEMLSLQGARRSDHLVAWRSIREDKLVLRWDLVDDSELPDIALDREYVEALFSSVPRKASRAEQEVARSLTVQRAGWWLVFVWLVVVPLAVAALEWWSDLLGVAVLAYAFIKAAITALRLTGHLPKSNREREREADELRARHHHYHCERNPEAFQRLKAENLSREETERTKAEARTLKAGRLPNSQS